MFLSVRRQQLAVQEMEQTQLKAPLTMVKEKINAHKRHWGGGWCCWDMMQPELEECNGDLAEIGWEKANSRKLHQSLISASNGGDKISVSTCNNKPGQLCSLAEQCGQTCVSLNSTSNLIISGGTDCAVNTWNLKTNKLQKSYKGHKDFVTCLTNDSDDHWILSGSRSGEIVLHSMHADEAAAKLCCRDQQPLRDLQISCLQASQLGSVGDDGTVVLWDLNSLRMQHSFKGIHKAPARALCFSPVIESLLVTVGLDKRISTIDTRSKSILCSIRAGSPLTAVELLADGTTLLIGSSQGRVSLYDFRKMEFPVKSSKAHSSATPWPTSWSRVKGEVHNVSAANDASNKNVTSDQNDSYSLQVSNCTTSQPPTKVMFIATNSFGEIFSPIRLDMNHTNISIADGFSLTPACQALNCSPLSESGRNIGDLSTIAARPAIKTSGLFIKVSCLAAQKCDKAQNQHCCNSELELIEKEINPKTVAKPLSHPSIRPSKEGEEEPTVPLLVVWLLENLLKDALEEFSEERHREIVQLQLAMIQEFQNQQIPVSDVILKHLIVREELIKEFMTLKEENQKLNIFR
ncbi:protein NEDD1-like [Rhinoraja longicauda]